MGREMSEENVRALFDTMAKILSRRMGMEIKATVRKRDEPPKEDGDNQSA